MTDRELMQQALEALEDACGGRCNAENNPCWQRSVTNALSERLAQPEQEEELEVLPDLGPAWSGLTDEEIHDAFQNSSRRSIYRAINSKLKEKNNES